MLGPTGRCVPPTSVPAGGDEAGPPEAPTRPPTDPPFPRAASATRVPDTSVTFVLTLSVAGAVMYAALWPLGWLLGSYVYGIAAMVPAALAGGLVAAFVTDMLTTDGSRVHRRRALTQIVLAAIPLGLLLEGTYYIIVWELDQDGLVALAGLPVAGLMLAGFATWRVRQERIARASTATPTGPGPLGEDPMTDEVGVCGWRRALVVVAIATMAVLIGTVTAMLHDVCSPEEQAAFMDVPHFAGVVLKPRADVPPQIEGGNGGCIGTYGTIASLDAVLAHYRQELESRGWRVSHYRHDSVWNFGVIEAHRAGLTYSLFTYFDDESSLDDTRVTIDVFRPSSFDRPSM
jgi:hypothetical protein